MGELNDPHALAEAIAQDAGYGTEVGNARFLTGGVSARIVAFDVGRESLVARLYGARDFASNPRIAELEFAVLNMAGSHGVPVAKPLHVLEAGIVGSRSGLLTTLIDGSTDQRPTDNAKMARLCAEMLRQIHRIMVPDELQRQLLVARFYPERWSTSLQALGLTAQRIEQLSNYAQNPTRASFVLLHGDFWPGNILWKDGLIAGIVDWEDVRFGDPRFDLACGFVELALATDVETGVVFLESYAGHQAADIDGLFFFILDGVLRLEPNIPRFGLSSDEEKAMRERLVEIVAFTENM